MARQRVSMHGARSICMLYAVRQHPGIQIRAARIPRGTGDRLSDRPGAVPAIVNTGCFSLPLSPEGAQRFKTSSFLQLARSRSPAARRAVSLDDWEEKPGVKSTPTRGSLSCRQCQPLSPPSRAPHSPRAGSPMGGPQGERTPMAPPLAARAHAAGSRQREGLSPRVARVGSKPYEASRWHVWTQGIPAAWMDKGQTDTGHPHGTDRHVLQGRRMEGILQTPEAPG